MWFRLNIQSDKKEFEVSEIPLWVERWIEKIQTRTEVLEGLVGAYSDEYAQITKELESQLTKMTNRLCALEEKRTQDAQRALDTREKA